MASKGVGAAVGRQKRKGRVPAVSAGGGWRRFLRRPWHWAGALVVLAVLAFGNWFAHLSTATRASFGALEPTLEALGSVTADLTDALGLTGRDAAIDYPYAVAKGPLPFGEPRVVDRTRVPGQVVVLRRKGYAVGYSPVLNHPIWAAYSVPVAKVLEAAPKRPPFVADPEVPGSPGPELYTNSGYDRGHMAPNSVIATRFGKKAQEETFLMTNISPQLPVLNRGPWRVLEQMIANELSEIGDTLWVIVCAAPQAEGEQRRLKKGRVVIPQGFAMIIAGVHNRRLRTIGVYMPQETPDRKRPRYCFRSVREIEQMTGLDFFPALSYEAQEALEVPEVTRFWPERALF